jgi:hypothetical protein
MLEELKKEVLKENLELERIGGNSNVGQCK